MFGEMIGAWIGDLSVQMGSPSKLTVLELGPGRGTLMADALRVASRVPGFANALSLALYTAIDRSLSRLLRARGF